MLERNDRVLMGFWEESQEYGLADVSDICFRDSMDQAVLRELLLCLGCKGEVGQ